MGTWYDERMKERTEKLFTKRTVLLEGEVNSNNLEQTRRLIQLLQTESETPITLLIDSHGGKADAAVHFYDFVRSEITVPLVGRVCGKCASAATIVLQACQPRLATRHSWFLVHSVALEISPLINRPEFRYGADLEGAARFMIQNAHDLQTITDKIIQRHSRQPMKVIRSWNRAGDRRLAPFRALEAKRRGLIDRVI